MVRVSDLRVRGGGTVTAGNAVPSAGELAVFCRPVVTASALPRRDGTVRADGWLPDFVRLGELERHLGDGVIEEIVAAAVEQGLLKRRQRRRIMYGSAVAGLALHEGPDWSVCAVGHAAPVFRIVRSGSRSVLVVAAQPPHGRVSLVTAQRGAVEEAVVGHHELKPASGR